MRLAHFQFAALSRADVHEGDDHTFDVVLRGAVGQRAAQVPPAAVAFDFAFDGHQVLQHGARIRQQVVVGELLREIGDRPADVGIDELEQIGHRRREAPHAELRIEEHHGDVGAAQQVCDVVGRRFELADLRLQLAVDGGQLFVDRLQLFLAGLELLVRALQLLVHRGGFFVRGLELFVGGFVGFRRALELQPQQAPFFAGGDFAGPGLAHDDLGTGRQLARRRGSRSSRGSSQALCCG